MPLLLVPLNEWVGPKVDLGLAETAKTAGSNFRRHRVSHSCCFWVGGFRATNLKFRSATLNRDTDL